MSPSSGSEGSRIAVSYGEASGAWSIASPAAAAAPPAAWLSGPAGAGAWPCKASCAGEGRGSCSAAAAAAAAEGPAITEGNTWAAKPGPPAGVPMPPAAPCTPAPGAAPTGAGGGWPCASSWSGGGRLARRAMTSCRQGTASSAGSSVEAPLPGGSTASKSSTAICSRPQPGWLGRPQQARACCRHSCTSGVPGPTRPATASVPSAAAWQMAAGGKGGAVNARVTLGRHGTSRRRQSRVRPHPVQQLCRRASHQSPRRHPC